MITLTTLQQESLDGPSITICRTWDLILRNGDALYFTDHDKPLVIGLKTYVPTLGFAAKSQMKYGGMKERDREIQAAIDHDLILEEDLLAGRYRDAVVKEAVVDWMNLGRGQFLKELYWIRKTASNGQIWIAETESITSWAMQPIGRNYTRDCYHRLGDTRCGKNVSAFVKTGSVSSLTTDGYSGQFDTDISGEAETNMYYNGELTFTSGENNGIKHAIKTYNPANGNITLWLEPVFPVTVATTVSISPGCPKTAEACKDWYNNLVNHGGFPYLVGTDRMFKTPDAKE